MDEKEILKKLGLTEYESQIILTLVSIGSAKVGEISKKCSVPKNKIYESLHNLLKKGIVREIPSTPKKYFIKNISDLGILLQQKQEEVKDLKKNFSKLKELKKMKGFPSVNEPIGIVYGHEAFVAKLKEAIQLTSKENLIVMRKVRNDPVMIRLTKEAIKRGAKIKIITSLDNQNKIEEWKKLGIKIRFIKEIPNMTFSTFDDKMCRLNINLTDNLSDPTLWIENKAFINLLKEKFESLWCLSKV